MTVFPLKRLHFTENLEPLFPELVRQCLWFFSDMKFYRTSVYWCNLTFWWGIFHLKWSMQFIFGTFWVEAFIVIWKWRVICIHIQGQKHQMCKYLVIGCLSDVSGNSICSMHFSALNQHYMKPSKHRMGSLISLR